MSVEAFPLDTKECASMPPSHCTKRANSVHTNVVPKQSQLKIKGACVHPGSKVPSFARWADNKPPRLKHTGYLVHFSCKCQARKIYNMRGDRWEAMQSQRFVTMTTETDKKRKKMMMKKK